MEQAHAKRRTKAALVGALVLLLWGLALPLGTASAEGQKTLRLVRPGIDSGPRAKAGATVLEAPDQTRTQELLEARWRTEQMIRQQLGPHGISQKGLALREARLARRAKATVAEPETLRILLIRIAFETDRSGTLTSITEDGDFQREPDPSILFDPPPHNRDYFEAHLDGLAEYWGSMSSGLLTIESQVLPRGRGASYKLSDLADYGPGSGGFWTVPLLERLVQDMITLADEQTQLDGSANLSEYDFDDPNTYVIFAHAGGDIQSNLSFTPGDPDYSPNDIPTFFVTLGDEAVVDLTSIDPDTNEPGRMIECSVIPESTNQDGLSGSIAAALYHEFGHALGLPDLYSTFTGLPTVGYWDIMDTGTNLAAGVLVEVAPDSLQGVSVTGLLPPQTSIWCKWFLGFADEIRADGRMETATIPSTHLQTSAEKAIRIDISPDEFFLVSNRWVPPAGDPDWGLVSDPLTGVVQFLGIFDGDTLLGNTHMYDFFLPWGGGVMIWRVRQDRVEENLAFNTVQALPENLGVELIEADGIQDIGVFEFTTRGFLGSDNDAFREQSDFTVNFGNGPETVTYPFTSTEFGPETFPPSRSSLRVDSGARVESIGTAGATGATVDVGIDGLLTLDGVRSAFPLELPPQGNLVVGGDASSPTLFEFDNGEALVVAGGVTDGSEPPGLYAYAFDGTPRLSAERFLDLTAPLSGPPAVAAEFQGTGSGSALVALSIDGVIRALDSAIDGGTGLPLEYFASTLPDSVDSPPLVIRVSDRSFILGAHVEQNRISVCDSDGIVHPEWEANFGLDSTLRLRSAPIAAKVVAGGSPNVVAYATGRGLELRRESGEAFLSSGEVWMRYPEGLRLEDEERGWLLAWPQEVDGPDRFVLVTNEGRSILFEPDGNGRWNSRFFGGRFDASPVAEPSLGDLDGDGRSELVVVTPQRVWARNLSGADAYGFPANIDDLFFLRELSGDAFVSSAVIADIDDDTLNEVLVQTDYGLLHGLEPDGSTAKGFPQTRAGRQAVAPLVVDLPDGANWRRAAVLFDALGDSLLSGRRTRPGRLTAVDLGPSADPAVPGPAEWLGRGGSSARGGRGESGTASSSTALADAIRNQEPMVYPNPFRGEQGETVFVRFFSGAAHTAKVTVYSLEGETILSAESDVTGDAPEELLWSAEGLVPGPYLCKLEYTGTKGPTTDLMTLYIER